MTKILAKLSASLALTLAAGNALADEWRMTITVDNQYDIYFGSATATDLHAGGDNDWTSVETWNASNRPATDYVYVAAASDQYVAQGFIGSFTNLTTGRMLNTGDEGWEVFPAGEFLSQINAGWPNPWPASLQPTQAQVDAAIAFAETNDLWIAPSYVSGWTNASHPGPWQHNIAGIPGDATWIWHDGPNACQAGYPAPYGGCNESEFLIFRVPGVAPEPSSLALLAVAAAGVIRRR